MKRSIVLILCSIILFLPVTAKNKELKLKDSFYKKGYSEIYKIDDSGIYTSRVFTFDNKSVEELKKRVGSYFNRRVERRISNEDANSQNASFVDNSIMISESTPSIKINFVFYAYARYTYRIDIKENRIRATIFLNSYYWGNNFPYLSPMKFYPFKSGGGFEKFFGKITEYIQSTLDSFPQDLCREDEELSDDW